MVNRKNQGGWVFAELVAACDPQARFWLNAKVLKNRQLWAAGWQTLSEIGSEIRVIASDYDPDAASGGASGATVEKSSELT